MAKKKEIDKQSFEKLCALQCTESEICAFFNVTDKTLASWCDRTYGLRFSEVFRQKREAGKISLRRMQWRHAEKNATMAIYLGKQYLGQRENVGVTFNNERDDDPITKALKESLSNGTERKADRDT